MQIFINVLVGRRHFWQSKMYQIVLERFQFDCIKNIIQLNILTIFRYKLISEASKYRMCKFYRTASNSLQAIQIVHELFDCPS